MELENCLISWREQECAVFTRNKYRGVSEFDAICEAQLKSSKLAAYLEEQKREMVKALFDDVICPMCYRLNPQHATMDNGVGCHWCSKKAYYLEQEAEK